MCVWLLYDHFPTSLTVFDRVDHHFQADGEVLSQQILSKVEWFTNYQF